MSLSLSSSLSRSISISLGEDLQQHHGIQKGFSEETSSLKKEQLRILMFLGKCTLFTPSPNPHLWHMALWSMQELQTLSYHWLFSREAGPHPVEMLRDVSCNSQEQGGQRECVRPGVHQGSSLGKFNFRSSAVHMESRTRTENPPK